MPLPDFLFARVCSMFSSKSYWLWLVSACFLVACDQSPQGGKRGQTIAMVNSDPITVHQLNNELMQLEIPPGADIDELTAETKRHLVDRQLLLQQAEEIDLERRPEVMQAIARSRNQLLAKAYLERVMASASGPTAQEIDEFYQAHPELFGKRRRYDFVQLIIDIPAEAENAPGLDEITRQIGKVDAIEDLPAWLDSRSYSYRMARMQQLSEEMQAPILEAMSLMEPGHTAKISAGDGIILLRLLSAEPAVISEDEAEPLISQILLDDKRQQVAAEKLESLRAQAVIKLFDKDAAKERTDETEALLR